MAVHSQATAVRRKAWLCLHLHGCNGISVYAFGHAWYSKPHACIGACYPSLAHSILITFLRMVPNAHERIL